MSIAYAMSDLAPSDTTGPGAVSVSGGCGQVHVVSLDADGRPVIECAVCAPILAASHYGWSSTPGGVPLTPDEEAEKELAERDGVAMQRIVLRSVTDSIVGKTVAGRAAKRDRASLAEELKALPEEDRAALIALLTVPPEPPAAPPAGTAGTRRKSRGVQDVPLDAD